MRHVAKVVVVDNTNHYLLMTRSDHPLFGDDPDLPGGTVEEGELLLDAAVREVEEETAILLDSKEIKEVYVGSDYSLNNNIIYALYAVRLDARPKIVMSWEHSSYDWVSKSEFLKRSHSAVDVYMHMVGVIMSRNLEI